MYSNVTFINIDDDNNVSLGQQRYDNGGNDCLSRDRVASDKTIFNDRRSPPPHKLFARRKSIFARTLNAATRDQLWARLIKLFDSVTLPPNTHTIKNSLFDDRIERGRGKEMLEIYTTRSQIWMVLMGLLSNFRFFSFFSKNDKQDDGNDEQVNNSDEERIRMIKNNYETFYEC